MLELNQVKTILSPQFEYLAKSHGEVLWLHSFSVWSILAKLAARIPRFTDKERLLLEVSALIHDIGKMRPKSQDILTNKGGGKVIHTATKQEIVDYLSPFIDDKVIPIQINDIDQIWEFALHHHISKDQQQETETPAYGIYADVVRYADWLSSMDQIDMTTVRQIQNWLAGICRLTVFNIGRYPSPTTYCLLQEATDRYHSLGWETLVVFDNGAIFIGDRDSILPSKNELSKSFTQKLIDESFRGMSIQNKYMRYEILSGKAKGRSIQHFAGKKKYLS
jgi:HD superfamily phosphodiesterase